MVDTVIVVAYYSLNKRISSDFTELLLSLVEFHEVIVVFVGYLEVDSLKFKNVRFLKFGDVGYDLNSYLLGYVVSMELHSVKRLIFINNSFKVVSVGLFLDCLSLLCDELDSYDFVGLVKSFEVREHYQSFCFGMNVKTAKGGLFNDLIERGLLSRPVDRFEVINDFELRSLDNLDFHGFSHKSLYRPTLIDLVVAYITFILRLGFVDTCQPLFDPKSLNLSVYGKKKIRNLYGIEKRKSSTIINNFKNLLRWR